MAKILIVDDDVVNSKLYANKLTSEGHVVELITDGSVAEKKTSEKYDLILLDIMVPGIDGLSLLQEFRKGTNSKTPILMFTNLVSDKTKKQSKELGASELLYKADTTPQILIKKIHDYVGNAPPAKDQKQEEDILKQAAE